MSNRKEINENEAIDVVGGALRWQGGKVYCLDNPSHVYTFTDYYACTDYIKNNWPGGAHTEDTLLWLESVGLVSRAY